MNAPFSPGSGAEPAPAAARSRSPSTTRDRLVGAMVEALRERGLHGIGLNELLVRADAPKGVLYHHFPGGKTALAVAAIETTVDAIAAALSRLCLPPAPEGGSPWPPDRPQPDLVKGLQFWLAQAAHTLTASDFERGCPLATVALESTARDLELRAALGQGFARLRAVLAQALAQRGVPDGEALALATVVISTYEGALMQARVEGRPDTLQRSTGWLLEQVQASLNRAAQAKESRP